MRVLRIKLCYSKGVHAIANLRFAPRISGGKRTSATLEKFPVRVVQLSNRYRERNPFGRYSVGFGGGKWLGCLFNPLPMLFPNRYKISKQAVRTGHTGGQLPKPAVAGIDVVAFAVGGD